MTIHIQDVRLPELMAQVDGIKDPGFYLEKDGELSIKGALADYQKLRQRIEDEKDPEEKEYLLSKVSTGICIYGWGGWHRYYVRTDGTVWFSEHHGASSVKDAVAAGFDIHR